METGNQITKLLAAVSLSAILSACNGGSSDNQASVGTGTEPAVTIDTGAVAMSSTDSGLDTQWYKRGAFMEINVRAYHDGNGDGVGDIQGIIQKLDYLRSLGISGIWLMPITQSGDNDHGYGVADYRKIQFDYGTINDLQQLVQEAHKRNIGVLIDYVMNHSSDQNPLFLNAKWGSHAKYRDWYNWSESKPDTAWATYSIFNTFPWYQAGQAGWYYGQFASYLPDFNLRNPDVVAYHKDNVRFWLNLGVDGFRFDAIPHFIENGAQKQAYQPETLSLVKEMREVINQYPKRYLVCEAAGWENVAASESGCKGAFAFQFDFAMRSYFIDGDHAALAKIANYPLQNNAGRLAPILANHDHFAGHRLLDDLHGDEAAYRLEAATYLTFPGTPFLYYGEEIGMSDMAGLPAALDPDWPQRGPMSWGQKPTVSNNSTTGNINHYYAPAPNIATHNVVTEAADPNSLLNFYTKLLHIRQDSEALRLGTYKLLTQTSNGFVFLRTSPKESVLVALNYGPQATSLALQLEPNTIYSPLQTYNADSKTISTNVQGQIGSSQFAMPAKSVQIFRASRTDSGPYLDVSGNLPAALYLVGDMTNWALSPNAQFIYSGQGLYTLDLNLDQTTTYRFHVTDSGPGNNVFGIITEPAGKKTAATLAAGAPIELEQTAWHGNNSYQGVGDDVQFQVSQPGRYRFTLDSRDALNPRLAIFKQ